MAKSLDVTGRVLEVYDSRTDLDQYGANKFAIFVAELIWDTPSLEDFAMAAIKDGADDKKIDLCYLDYEEKKALIAQVYESKKWGQQGAKSNKAADLSTALSWLLRADLDKVPNLLRTDAESLRNSIESGEIDQIEIAFIHNCRSDANSKAELEVVKSATQSFVKDIRGTDRTDMLISAREVSIETIYQAIYEQNSRIQVNERIRLTYHGDRALEQAGEKWRATVISVLGGSIAELYRIYKDELFSANFRDFLGTKKSKKDINNTIKETAQHDPGNFWVFNNGITALTSNYEFGSDDVGNYIELNGISIINGAQTTGSLAAAGISPNDESISVICRIVQCNDEDVIDRIVKSNNTQNAILSHDERSKDRRTVSLANSFKTYGITLIQRRSSTRPSGEMIQIDKLGPILRAFHGDPQTAFRNPRSIFQDTQLYEGTFTDSLTAEHTYLVWTLYESLRKKRAALQSLKESGRAPKEVLEQLDFLQYPGSRQVILYIVGKTSEYIMGQSIASLYGWKCKPTTLTDQTGKLLHAWESALEPVLLFVGKSATQLANNRQVTFYEIPRSRELHDALCEATLIRMSMMPDVVETRSGELRQLTYA